MNVPGPALDEKAMRDVSGVVDAESDGDDEVVARHRVDGQAPKVHEAADLHQAEDDAQLLVGSWVTNRSENTPLQTMKSTSTFHS